MNKREIMIPWTVSAPFEGEIHARLREIGLEYHLRIMYSDKKCLILESPHQDRYLKYVVDPETGKLLDQWLQSVVLRGLRNQHAV